MTSVIEMIVLIENWHAYMLVGCIFYLEAPRKVLTQVPKNPKYTKRT
jgi:hypothetical protein